MTLVLIMSQDREGMTITLMLVMLQERLGDNDTNVDHVSGEGG